MTFLSYINFEWENYWVNYLYNSENNSIYPSGDYRPDEYDYNKDSFFWYKDENLNNKLDSMDLFIINKTSPGYHYSLKFFDKEGEYLFILDWVPGIILGGGNYPLFTFKQIILFDNKTNKFNITLDSIIGIQGIYFFELDFYLYENGIDKKVNLNSNYNLNYLNPHNETTIEIFHNDLDGNKRVTINDVFSINNCKNGREYKFEIYYNQYFCGSFEWVTYNLE